MSDNLSNDPITWDTLARHALTHPNENHEVEEEEDSEDQSGLDRCLQLYETGLEQMKCKQELTGYFIETLIDLSGIVGIDVGVKTILTRTLLRTLERADEDGILSEDHYEDWVSASFLKSVPHPFFPSFPSSQYRDLPVREYFWKRQEVERCSSSFLERKMGIEANFLRKLTY